MFSLGSIYLQEDINSYKIKKNIFDGRELDYDTTNEIAFNFFQKSAKKNNKYALYAVGNMYFDGNGILKDQRESLNYYKRAASFGHFGAMQKLALAYFEGLGTVKDYSESYKWVLKAANANENVWEGVPTVRNVLGKMYENGWGVEKDLIIAYAWYNIAASGSSEKAKNNLDRIEELLSSDELFEAQSISSKWEPGLRLVRKRVQKSKHEHTPKANDIENKVFGVGTGFFVTTNGVVVTNNHVIESCDEIKIPSENKTAKLLLVDKTNDLALIKIDTHNQFSAVFPDSDILKQGEEIYVFGYPLDGFLPSTGNLTTGIISAMAGPSNNSSLIQISAPVQPGNSGGPLLNQKGSVVGVIVGKADALNIAKHTGDIPQNVNFAISPKIVRSFLESNQIDINKSIEFLSFRKSSIEVADLARKITLKIECIRGD